MSSDPVASGLAAQPRRWQFSILSLIVTTALGAVLVRFYQWLHPYFHDIFTVGSTIVPALFLAQFVWSLHYLLQPGTHHRYPEAALLIIATLPTWILVLFHVGLSSVGVISDGWFFSAILLGTGIVLTINAVFFTKIIGIAWRRGRACPLHHLLFCYLTLVNLALPFLLVGMAAISILSHNR